MYNTANLKRDASLDFTKSQTGNYSLYISYEHN